MLDKFDALAIWAAFWDPSGIPDLFIAYQFDITEFRFEFVFGEWKLEV